MKYDDGITFDKLAYSVEELSAGSTLSKAFIRNAIRAGELKAKRFGARVLVLASDWHEYARNKADWK